MSFRLAGATVHYGMSSYPLNCLPSRWDRVESAEAIDKELLARDVGRLTGFPREFRVVHAGPLHFNDKQLAPERIVALANGYTITWNKEA